MTETETETGAPAAIATARRRAVLFGLAALAAWVAVLLPAPDFAGGMDFTLVHGFYKRYLAEAVAAGRLPLWNPHVALGRPFLADVDATVFYPPDLLYLALEPHVAAVLLTLGHLGLALWGFVRLGRRLGARGRALPVLGVGFTLSAPLVGGLQGGLVHYVAALCYLPLALSLVLDGSEGRRLRSGALLGLTLGLQLLGGHPQACWITGLGAVLLLLGRSAVPLRRAAAAAVARDLAWLLAAAGGGVALAGVVVLPLAELMGESNRQAASVAFSSSFAMRPADWASLVLAPSPSFQVPSPAMVYPGLAVVSAGLTGLADLRRREVRALLVMASVAALVAAGDSTPAFRVLYRVVPALGAMRIHARASILLVLALFLGAALLLDGSAGTRRRLGLAAVGASGAAAGAAWAVHCSTSPLPPLLLGGVSTALLVAHLGPGLRPPVARALAVGLAAVWMVDLGVAARSIKALYALPELRPDDHPPGEEATAALLREAGLLVPGAPPPRISMPWPWSRQNAGMRYGWSTFTGYAALQLGRVWNYLHVARGLQVPLAQNTVPAREIYQAGPFPYDTMALVLGLDPVSRRPVLRREPDPRAYLVQAAAVVADHQAAAQRMAGGHDVHRVALLEAAPTFPLGPAGGAAGHAAITRFEPEDVVLAVDAPAPSLLVLAEAYYPGWTATVDGQTAPCLPANAWMRAVPVPAGRSEVELRYRCRPLRAGVALSAGGLVALLGCLALSGRRRARVAPHRGGGAREHPGSARA